jgi:hypothetical protein
MSDKEVNDALQNVNDLFTEARELVGEAYESIGSTYYPDDIEDAKTATADALGAYAALLEGAEPGRSEKLRREYTLKFRQLEGELEKVLDH